jgi:hypothetical protein
MQEKKSNRKTRHSGNIETRKPDSRSVTAEFSALVIGIIDAEIIILFLYRGCVKNKYKWNQIPSWENLLMLTQEQASKAQTGIRGIYSIYSFFNLRATWEWVVNSTPRPF